MNFIRRYHRAVRAFILLAFIGGALWAWNMFVDPLALTLDTARDLVTVFMIIAVAGFVARSVGKLVAPPEPGQQDEEGDDPPPPSKEANHPIS